MSHASVLVVVEVTDPGNRKEVEAAVHFQMDPYDENGECFRDASRWDWWVIGGRFTGALGDKDIVQVKSFDPSKFKRAYAFLRDRHWHEPERMGWFGCTAITECEMKAKDDPDVVFNRCLTIGDEKARVVTWNEPCEIWLANFAERFLLHLPPEAVLVLVDYHV